MFHSILCATDFSRRGDHALAVAASWAESQGATLDVLHVVPPVITAAAPATDAVNRLHASIQKDAERKLGEIVAGLAPRVRATSHVCVGFPRDEILARAKAVGSDLIVLATAGQGAIARALLGSVADRVLRASELPVLLVPEEAAAARPTVLLAPTDLTPASEHAVTVALDLALELSASVEVVHAYEIPHLLPRSSTVVKDLSLTLREGVRSLHQLGARANLHVMEGPPARSILEVATSARADLIVMAGSGRGLVSSLLLGGVTDRVVRTSHVPVLVLRGTTGH